MKKLILAFALVIGLTTFAQEAKKEKGQREKLTPEQQVELQVKKMKLDLDLNEKQIAQVKEIVTAQVSKRETKRAEYMAKKAQGTKPSSDDVYKIKNERLDDQIALKEAMKKILSAEQFAKWENKRDDREEKFKEKMEHRKNKGMKKAQKEEDK